MAQKKNLIRYGNSKLHKDGIGSFSLPAGMTCPYAGECAKWCYARTGTFRFIQVREFYEFCLRITKQKGFEDRIVEQIISDHARGKLSVLRIHASGDFYSQEYFDKWVRIAYRVPDVILYAYTKSLPFIRDNLPRNLVIIQSEGGRLKIDKRKKHAVVFPSEEEAIKAGYNIANGSDLVALGYRKVALISHGEKKSLFNRMFYQKESVEQ